MNRIILFHHTANTAIAESIVHRLGRIGIPFETITEKTGETPGDIAATLQAHQEPVLLIITDNFLKDTHCMADMLSAFQAVRRERRVVTVVADGRQSDDGGASWHPVPTHYDRMVHALQYMNYWQNAWLELSDRHGASTDASEKEHLLGLLNITRNIANEMGDFIGTLREAEVFSLEQLEENHFALFFQRFGLNDWYDQYRDKEIAIQTAAMRMQEVDTPEPLPAPPEETPVIPERVAETYFSPASSEPVETHEQPTAPSAENISAAQPLIAPHFEQEEHLLKELLPDPEKTHTEIEQHIHDAWFWLNNGRIEQGLAILQTALEAFPDNERLRTEYEKASALQSLPDGETAQEAPAAADSAPDQINTDILSSEARSYELMGDMAYNKQDYLFAKYCWDRTIELAPGYPGIYRKLGTMVSEHMPEYRETGMQYLKNALIQDPKDAPSQLAAARLAIQNGEYDAAEVYYRSAIGLNPLLKTPENDHLFLPGYLHVPVTAESTRSREFIEETAISDDSFTEPVAEAAPIDEALPVPSEIQEETHHDLPVEHVEMPALQELADVEFDEPVLTIHNDRAALYPPSDAEGRAAENEAELRAKPAASEDDDETEAAFIETVPAPQPLTVLVTGATSGIGRAIAALFAQNGHRLVVTGRRVERLAALKKEFESQWNTSMLMLPFDVRDNGAVRAALENLPDGWQDIDILVNNAGLAKGLAPVHEGDLTHWDTMIDTNLKGLLYVTRAVAPGMVRRQRGHIINVGSIAGQQVYPNGNVYCASKAGVDALTQAMRMDLYTHNIRVSQVSPGHVEETEFALNRFDGDGGRARQVYDNFQPLLPADIAEIVYFMATRPHHVNVQDVVVFSTQQGSATLIDRSGRKGM